MEERITKVIDSLQIELVIYKTMKSDYADKLTEDESISYGILTGIVSTLEDVIDKLKDELVCTI